MSEQKKQGEDLPESFNEKIQKNSSIKGKGRDRPYLIGICGGSGSGKTSVSNLLFKSLGIQNCLLFSMDTYYKDLTPEQEKDLNNYNFDSPEALDLDLLSEHLSTLMKGKPINMPTYDFCTNKRQEKTVYLKPNKFIIFEGILAFHDERIRNLMDLKIFVDVDDDICLSRRIFRDVTSRGRQLESVIERYHKFVKPAYHNFIKPTHKYADLIIPRGAGNSIVIDLLNYHLKFKLKELYPENDEIGEIKENENEEENDDLGVEKNNHSSTSVCSVKSKKDEMFGVPLAFYRKDSINKIQFEDIFDDNITLVEKNEENIFLEIFGNILSDKKVFYYCLYMDILTKKIFNFIKGKTLIIKSYETKKIIDILKEKILNEDNKNNQKKEIVIYIPILLKENKELNNILKTIYEHKTENFNINVNVVCIYLVKSQVEFYNEQYKDLTFKSIYFGDILINYKVMLEGGGFLRKEMTNYSNVIMTFTENNFEYNLIQIIEKLPKN